MGTEPKRYQSFISDSARWLLFEPRPGDIVISTPPKCGTTLTQMLCALVLFDSAEFPGRMDDLSPWLDQRTRSDEEVLTQLEAQTHRRFIKTHTPLDGIPEWPDVTYVAVGRDPRDVFVSWEHHVANMDVDHLFSAIDGAVGIDTVLPFIGESPETIEERFDLWLVDDDPMGRMSLALVAGHIEASWDRRDRPERRAVPLRGAAHRPSRAMTRSGRGIRARAVDRRGSRNSPKRRRSIGCATEPTTSHRTPSRSSPTPTRFFRSGEGGDWRSFVTPEQDAVYWQRIDELMSPELRDWLHRADG